MARVKVLHLAVMDKDFTKVVEHLCGGVSDPAEKCCDLNPKLVTCRKCLAKMKKGRV